MDAVWNSNGLWTPPGLDGNMSLTSTNQFISLAIGFTSVLLLAKLPTLIPEMIFQLKPSPLGKAIGEGFGSVPGVKLGQTGINMAREGFFKSSKDRGRLFTSEHAGKNMDQNANSQQDAPPSNNA